MSNPSREDIIEAHKALTNLLKLASGKSTASAIFNERIVRDALPPMPQPTMAEVEWDDSPHLREYRPTPDNRHETESPMTNTIEVPISLIKEGNLDAIRELLSKTKLFGRWATHPEYGRGVICSMYARNGYIQFAYESREVKTATVCDWVFFDSLTLDPVELVTVEDFEGAPEGTILADSFVNAYQKADSDEWVSVNDELSDSRMAFSGPWKVLRWGWGE